MRTTDKRAHRKDKFGLVDGAYSRLRLVSGTKSLFLERVERFAITNKGKLGIG